MLTQYITSVHPSNETHWKTVSMANPILSKFVIPLFGPSQVVFVEQTHLLRAWRMAEVEEGSQW